MTAESNVTPSDSQRHLGPFELIAPLASGGMGLVWRAIHTPTQTPVAVKTLKDAARTDLDAFRREIQAAARLSHPNIIELFDFGVIRKDMGPQLSEGTPWLAMELAESGSLVGYKGIDSFSMLYRLCLDILAALAHSHARQIIHRDLKPGNVLIGHGPQGITFKLTDFGIAHARGESTNTREVFASSAGTPWYMSPEQIESRWRDYGPWTDLYALGCMAWEFATGETPFTGDLPLLVARAHLQDELPEFKPRFQVPDGFAGWLERLLAKSPRARFQRAADASWSLSQIGAYETHLEPATREFIVPENAETLDFAHSEPTVLSEGTLPFIGEHIPRPAIASTSTLVYFSRPPIDEDWRDTNAMPDRPVGAGLGLFDYREVPLVGREHERDTIWSALRQAALERKPQIILVRGPAGGGKTSLLQWVERRAHETGAASVTWMTHRSEDSAENGLSGTLIRYLGCTGLTPERAEARLRQTLDGIVPPEQVAYNAVALTAIMFGSASAQFWSPLERFSALLRLTKAYSTARPFVLLIDDAQRGFESLQLIQTLLNSNSEVPLLVVIAANDDALDVDEHVRAKIDDIAYDKRVKDVALSRLTDDEQHLLVSRLIDLDPTLESSLISASRGQPVYTLQLLQKWIDEGALVQEDGRFKLAQPCVFPVDVHEILVSRYASHPGVADLLKTAALVADVVPREIWMTLQSRLGLTGYPPDYSRAVDTHPAGFAFVSSLIREAFVALAHRDRSAVSIHATIAEVYAARAGHEARRREASHRVAAGQMETAVPVILRVIDHFVSERRIAEAQAWVELARAAVSDAELLRDDPRVTELWRHRAALAYAGGALGDALDAAANVLENTHDPVEKAEAGRLTALAHMRRGEFQAAQKAAEQALKDSVDGDAPQIEGDARRALGWVHLRHGSLDSAVAEMQAATQCYARADQKVSEGLAAAGACGALRLSGRFDDAHVWLNRALQLVSAERHRGPWGELQLEAGILAENENRLDAARTHLSLAQEALHTVGNPVRHLALLCLSLVETRLGDAAVAQKRLLESQEDIDKTAPVFAFYARTSLAYVAASMKNGAAWDRWYQESRLRILQFRELDLARYLTNAAHAWAEVGDRRRQREALELARILCGPGNPPIRQTIDVTLEAM